MSYRPPKPPPRTYLDVYQLKKGQFYTCRLAKREVMVIEVNEPGHRSPGGWSALAQTFCEGAGYVTVQVHNGQLYH